MATVTMTPDSAKQYAGLPKAIRERVRKIVARLAKWPDVSGAKALAGD